VVDENPDPSCPILTLLPTPEQDDELLKLPLNGDEGGGEMK
jgi:hypothetical protein